MKKKILFSLFIIVFFNVQAQDFSSRGANTSVSEEAAYNVGLTFLGDKVGVLHRNGGGLELDTVFRTPSGHNAFYVFNAPRGFVMVAADTRVAPVIAYSSESQFHGGNMPESLQELLEGYVMQVQYAIDSVDAASARETALMWNIFLSGELPQPARSQSAVPPLLRTLWNQNSPYNSMCPADPAGPEGHVYAGCVATALAQIFKYWLQPANGLGSNSYNCNFTSEGYGNYGFLSVDFTTGNYNYNMMPNSLSNATSEEIAEVAKLIYHCGVAVEMKYGANGSGAFDSKALSALKNFFGYTTAQLVKKTAYTDPEWKSLLKSELLQMRPVYYSGSGSSGGHAFVCDGFDENDMFHFNWGWSGSNNGYYTLTSLTPGNKNFSSGQTAIIGIDAAQPKIRASKHAVSFLSPCGTVSESKSVFIISTSLVQTINATVVGNFGVSIDSSTYLQNLDINSTGGKLHIRHNGSEVGATEQGLLILSSGSATDTVYLTGNTFVDVFDCLPPQNLVISTQDLQHVNLNWNSPTVDHDPKYLSWSSENVSVFSGYASYYRFTMLQRYCETDILPYHNKSITAIRFYADAEASLFKAVVYSGGSFEGGFNPGTLVYSQDIDRSSLNLNDWNTITLDTSVIVDAAQELCFGIYLEAPAGTYAIPRCSGGVAYKGCVYGYHSSNSVSWNEYSQEYTYPLGVIVENAQKVVDYTILRDGSILGTTNDPFYQDYVDSSKTFNYTVVANWSNNCSDSTMKSFKNVAQISSVPERVDIFTNYGYGLNVKKVVIAGCGLESSIHAFVDGDFQISSDSVNYSSSQTLPASGGALFVKYSPSSSSEQFESGLLILSSDNIVTNVPITAQIYNECTPPKNLLLSQNGNNISLTWESPDLQTVQQYPLSWYESPGNLSYGSNHSEIKRYIVHRFDTNDLAPYHGKQLTSVSFIPHNSVTTYKIVVYKGGSERTSQYFSSGTKIVEQDVDISTLTAGEWNSIQLQNPVMVDASQELWYGVYLESPKGSYPIQLGTPYVAKKGLITKPSTNPDNYWTEYSVNSLSYCFSLKSTIEDVPNTLSKFLIDRNEIEVGETNENYYSDTLIYNGGYDYRVWALWNDGCKVAISDSIFVADLCDRESVSFSEESCNEYVWNDVTYLESGTYYHSYLLPNGCLSTDTLHLTINTAHHQSQTHTAIDSYAWNGTTYTESGTYTYSHTAENGCEQVDTLHLTLHYSTANEVYATACDNYTWNAETYTSSGDYEQTFLTTHGADSVVTLHLTINSGTFNSEIVAECGSYEWHGATYTESGTYVHEYTNDDGCQSADTLHLTINNSVTENTEQTICSSELPYTWRDTIFGAGSESGDYVFTKTTSNGCDSVVTLHLIINNSVTETTEQTICSSELPYTWRDTIFGAGSESGDYMFTKTAANGCDSVVTLQLTINTPQHQSQTHTAIYGYAWNGTTYTESGTYTYSHTDENGCDQVDTLHLTIYRSAATEFSVSACDSYTWNAETYTSSGDYEQTFLTTHGADSVVTLHLTIN
ncbi:MAG: C10 family peptidase, partial [Bacteroidales bacterium]|nr:C10 family peptidase [Bacteroidales bacterium]